MMFQLPNGKVICLSVEEYLDLTDSDIQYLMSIDAGNASFSPWHQSAIKNTPEESRDDIDTSIDYSFGEDEISFIIPDVIEEPMDNLPEVPDSDTID